MKIIAILFGRAIKDFSYFIDEINNVDKDTIIRLVTQDEYLLINTDEYDVLLYNTFPDEKHWKFNTEIVSKCDKKFHNFKGLKILFDTHDNGTRDGFTRFNGLNLPRIKANPCYDIINKMNVIAAIPYFCSPSYCRPSEERVNKIVCAMRTKRMPFIRKNIYEKIKQFNPDNEWLPFRKHASRLCHALINIVPTGNGDSSKSHVDTLAAGALLMAEKNITNIKILPYADLEDGKNFVSFNLDNVCDKLDFLLNNYERVTSIRVAGLNAFKVGYNPNKSANQLLNWIKSNI